MIIRSVEGEDRRQTTLLPSCLDDYVIEENRSGCVSRRLLRPWSLSAERRSR